MLKTIQKSGIALCICSLLKHTERLMMGIEKILFQIAYTLEPLLMLCTLCLQAAMKMKTVFAHRVRRVVQVVDARGPIGGAPCLQIRVGRFDSGPRLHKNQ